jgi:NAD(P)-dependent dehydrogenase (short-subunit alcohol dehydrogenase family)
VVEAGRHPLPRHHRHPQLSSHALTLAQEGADIIGLDLCGDIDSTTYPGTAPADLDETERLIKETGRRAVLSQADVRDYDQVKAAFERGLEQLGRVDIIIPNAGICAGGKVGRRHGDRDAELVRRLLD